MPRTAATGCMIDSLEEKDVEAAGMLLVVIAATGLPRGRLTRSMSFCIRDLYVAGLGKSFGQFMARWSTKNFLHLTQPSLSLRSLRSESSSFGHCLRGADVEDVAVACGMLLLLVLPGKRRDDVSEKLLARREDSVLSLAIRSYSSLSVRRTSSHLLTSFSHLRKLATLFSFSEETFFESLTSIPATS